jgi:hypothetical protein
MDIVGIHGNGQGAMGHGIPGIGKGDHGNRETMGLGHGNGMILGIQHHQQIR